MKSFGKYSFVFDEDNYTALDIDSKEMNILYDQQKYLFNKYALRSFLFICTKLNRTIEDAYSIRNNIRNHSYYVCNLMLSDEGFRTSNWFERYNSLKDVRMDMYGFFVGPKT